MKLGEENIEVAIQHWEYLRDQKWEQAREQLSDEFEAFWPQSKEKMDANGFIEVNRNYPGTHKIQVLNHTHEYDNWEHRSKVITETHIQSEMPDGKRLELFAISIFEMEDCKIISLIEYWADTYQAPEWRKQWVQKY